MEEVDVDSIFLALYTMVLKGGGSFQHTSVWVAMNC